MKMKRDMFSCILHLWILISLVLVVRCDEDEDDENEFPDDKITSYDDGFVPPTAEYATDPKIISRDVKCLVCKATIREMELAIKKVDPRKKIEVSGFRMDPSGNSGVKSVQYSKSEMYLTELMETICKRMDDYAKARHKISRKLTVIKLMTEDGTMNPLMSAVDFVQDGDLNKSLEHFMTILGNHIMDPTEITQQGLIALNRFLCLEVLEDHEEAILQQFMQEVTPENIDYTVCTETAKYCNEDGEAPEDGDREAENNDRDEL